MAGELGDRRLDPLWRGARRGDVGPARHLGLGRRFHNASATRSSSSRESFASALSSHASESGVCTTTGPLP